LLRADVQVVEEQSGAVGLDDEEADALAAELDVTRVRGREAREEALPSADGIEPSDALQALAHGLHAEVGELLGLFEPRAREGDRESRGHPTLDYESGGAGVEETRRRADAGTPFERAPDDSRTRPSSRRRGTSLPG
jgi:hypothetical protein